MRAGYLVTRIVLVWLLTAGVVAGRGVAGRSVA